MNVRAGKSPFLWVIIFIMIGFAAFQAAQGEWASAAVGLVAVVLFWLLVRWIERHHSTGWTEADAIARRRKLTILALPFMIVVFTMVAIRDLVENDWLGALFAAVGLGALLAALWSNRSEPRKQ